MALSAGLQQGRCQARRPGGGVELGCGAHPTHVAHVRGAASAHSHIFIDNKIQKGQIWCVYDKDSFPAKDFNGVEQRARKLSQENPDLRYHAAWSNECIEFWFLLHFAYYTSNNHRIELTGTLLDVKDYHCNFVGSDTKRLAIIRQNTQSIGTQISIIIPKRAIMEIAKLFYDEFEIYFSSTMLFIKSQNYTFSTKLINGKYPDYEKIIPKEFKTQLKLPKNEIIEAIKLMNPLSTNVKITFDSNGLLFEAMSSEELESASTQVEIPLNITESITLGTNSRYILDFLALIHSTEFEILINEANMPFMLKDENYSTIIMPVLC